jgi:aspartyl-tRNA(Asn)/glutamyl-tRNA(Gln) amidotransferase subunit A
MELYELTAEDAIHAMRSGELSPVELVKALLDRIHRTEPKVCAWEHVDAERALDTARQLESKDRAFRQSRLLYGLPVGIKDIFDVCGLPTKAGFRPYSDRIANQDSGVVEQLRNAGAIILGKTVTVQFAAGSDPPKTRNPWNFEKTPGGSSTGSAVAVSTLQVPIATGTQTGGSLLRPAAYCGAVGFKPTFGRLSRYGILPVSWSLDHAGVIVRTVPDAALLLQALACYDPRDAYSSLQDSEDFPAAVRNEEAIPPRLGLVVDLLDRSTPAVRNATEQATQLLVRSGADLHEVRLPVPMNFLLATHYLISRSELAAIHAEQYSNFAEHYEPNLRAHIEVGQLLPASVYVHAKRLQRRFRLQILHLVETVDGLVAPTASGLPPQRSSGTGDPSFQTIWSLCGLPNITLPTGLSEERLPYAVQIIGRPFAEGRLLGIAAWAEKVFGHLPPPL